MPMDWSPWKSLKSDGTIAEDLLPCSYFQYRYSILEQIFFGMDDLDRNYKVIKGRWGLQIVDPQNQPVFKQEVKVEFDVYYSCSEFFGQVMLTLFVWQSPKSAIITSVPSPVETVGGEYGYYYPASGADYTADYGWILASTNTGDQGFWYSPIYKARIEPGSKFQVLFHNIGVSAWGNKLMAIQIRTSAAAAEDRNVSLLWTPEDNSVIAFASR